MRSRRGSLLPDLDTITGNDSIQSAALDVVHHLFEKALRVSRIRRDTDNAQNSMLPRVQLIHFGNRDIEIPPDARRDRLDHVAFVLQPIALACDLNDMCVMQQPIAPTRSAPAVVRTSIDRLAASTVKRPWALSFAGLVSIFADPPFIPFLSMALVYSIMTYFVSHFSGVVQIHASRRMQ